MIDTDKYKGHSKTIKTGCWKRSAIIGFKSESVFDESGRQIASVKLAGYDTKRVKETYANLLLITDAPKLLAEVKRLQYLEKYAPTFQVFAQNEEDMEEEYTQHGSLKECEEYIATLKDGWVGRIEVIEYYVPTNNPQIKTIEEWRNEE
jgi:hypothetical protein|tara:strand:+ start:308 stop:754 length:447 start_codon:yes stop_codon:yes gene_type:complete